jgi:hypothetical protein
LNAGKYIPVDLVPVYENNMLVPPKVVLEAGDLIWKDSLVGFFLDKPLSYTAVVYRLKLLWKLKGSVRVKSDGTVFLFNFSCDDDREKILQCDPVIIKNKLFIIKPYDATVSNISGSVPSVPVWVHFYNLPLYAWSPLGINWLSSHLGKLLCMDEMTEKQSRMSYAKCLIEVKPDRELPHEFLVKLVEGGVQKIYVQYQWRPDVCIKCKKFGHATNNCDAVVTGNSSNTKERNKKDRPPPGEAKVNKVQGNRNFNPPLNMNDRTWQKVVRKKSDNFIRNKDIINTAGDKVEEYSEVEEKRSLVNQNDEGNKQDHVNIIIETSKEQGEITDEDVEEICIPDETEEVNELGIGNNLETNVDVTVEDILLTNKFDALMELEDTENVDAMLEENENSTEVEEQETKGKEKKTPSKAECIQLLAEQGGIKNKHVKIKPKRQANQQELQSIYNSAIRNGNMQCEKDKFKLNEVATTSNGMKIHMSQNQGGHHALSAADNMHKIPMTCTDVSSHLSDNPTTPSQFQINHYSDIIPPKAYKPPKSSTQALPNKSLISPIKDRPSNNDLTPLSATIPNYLASKHAVTRKMKLEMLNTPKL